ncbi:sulfite exporter taue/safe [Lucifera butyrica]|uniref:Probable membrane transporter protein n=1 Tax=Lucifera butyrica TaxID=1351585 RepID=A0A498R1G6_9FIRM|nr:sulfite exporter TauE/SafE family protein [Lucifera butyrica]VBB04995.1 sulfite exporter taue/safe [Lucifera butyrica]
MLIFFTMFGLGLLLGFIGAGGAGTVIALLVTVFGVPIHTALGTSLSGMIFTTLSGAFSHFREGNIVTRIGTAVGIFGAAGAFTGAKIAVFLPSNDLKCLTAGMLFLCGILFFIRFYFASTGIFSRLEPDSPPAGFRFWTAACGLGIVTGILSGTFGIGATPFIQIGLLVFFGMSIQQAAGTTMLIILPIALLGGLGYLTEGYLDAGLFLKVTAGLMSGSYMGAKFTNRLPLPFLKAAMVSVPILGGFLLLWGS